MTDAFKEECRNEAYKNRLGKVEFSDETFTNSDTLSSIEMNDSCVTNDNLIGSTNSKTLKFTNLGNDDLTDKEFKAEVGASLFDYDILPFKEVSKTVKTITAVFDEKGYLIINGQNNTSAALEAVFYAKRGAFVGNMNLHFKYISGSFDRNGGYSGTIYVSFMPLSSGSGKIFQKDFANSNLDFSIDISDDYYLSNIEFDFEGKNIFNELKYQVYIGDNEPYSEEYVSLGEYVVTSEDISDTSKNGEYTCSDLSYKLDKVYKCGMSEEELAISTIGDFYADACKQAGLTPSQTTFTNSTIAVGGNPFTNNETIRTVISQVAQAGCYFTDIDNENGNIDLIWFGDTVVETFDKSQYSSLTKNQVFGPVNSVVIGESAVDGNNYTKEDEESIAENGETQISILDNYFLSTDALREEAMDGIYEKLHGFTYTNYELTSNVGKPYLKRGDKISIVDMSGNSFDSYVLNHTFTYDGTFKSVLSADSLGTTQQAIKNTQSISNTFKRTQRSIDRINGKIEDIVEEQTDTQQKVSQVTQDVDSIASKVEIIEHVKTVSSESFLMIATDDKTIASNIIQFVVEGTDNEEIPITDITNIEITHKEDKTSDNYTYSLDGYKLEKLGDACDYVDITHGKLYKYIGLNDEGEKIVLDEPIEYSLTPLSMALKEGINNIYITIPDNTNPYKIILKYKNSSVTDELYATQSSLVQTATDITSEVSKTYITKTTEENDVSSLSSRIQQTATSIELTTTDNNTSAGIKIQLKNEDGADLGSKEANITMSGMVKFTDLSNAGSTTINGGNITTGSINCDRLSGGTINGQTISGGTISGSSITGGTLSISNSGKRNMATFTDTANKSATYIQGSEVLIQGTSNTSYYEIMENDHLGIHAPNNTCDLYSTDMGFMNGSDQTIFINGINGTIRYYTLSPYSKVELKKNISKYNDNAINLVSNSDIYTYNYKIEDDNCKKRVGFIIGDGYNTPIEVINDDKEGIDLYSMCSILWKAVQEQQKQIEDMEAKLEKIDKNY